MTGQRALLVFSVGAALLTIAGLQKGGPLGPSIAAAQDTAEEGDAQNATDRDTDPDTERARSLFREGVALSDAGRWTMAAERFRQALALKDAMAIRYNLGSALIELGDFQEADRLLRQVTRDEGSAEALRRSATQARGDIRARAAELRFTEPQVTRVNGRFLPRDFLDQAMFVVPGEHVIEHVGRGRVLEQRIVTLEAASITTVRWTETTWRSQHQPPSVAALARAHHGEGPSAQEEGGSGLKPIPFSPLQPSDAAAVPGSWGAAVAVAMALALVAGAGVYAAVTSDGTVESSEFSPKPGGPFAIEVLNF